MFGDLEIFVNIEFKKSDLAANSWKDIWVDPLKNDRCPFRYIQPYIVIRKIVYTVEPWFFTLLESQKRVFCWFVFILLSMRLENEALHVFLSFQKTPIFFCQILAKILDFRRDFSREWITPRRQASLYVFIFWEYRFTWAQRALAVNFQQPSVAGLKTYHTYP